VAGLPAFGQAELLAAQKRFTGKRLSDSAFSREGDARVAQCRRINLLILFLIVARIFRRGIKEANEFRNSHMHTTVFLSKTASNGQKYRQLIWR
jgi:hypothetical protein